MSSDTVNVALRIRPLITSETSRGCQNIIQKTTNQPQVLINCGNRNDMFTFNHVFAPEETQEMLYENSVKPLINKLIEGYNVTILAYGQTGSGKTHTMGTAYDGCDTDECGVIPRAVNDIFDKIELMSDFTFLVQCSFMELYQEQLFDLLSDNPREHSVVDIREDGKNILIPNLTEIAVSSAEETTAYLMKGSKGRAVGATAMNATSSRSHAIFTITIYKSKAEDTLLTTRSRFHLVDLAGSERSKKTKATGERFKEGVKINQGLLALGNVISALGTNTQNTGYIGYRDSKLTRLLRDSLGGNSVTLMIACISPADYNLDETISTLRYADRAKQIKNKPIVNQDPKTAEINRLNDVIQKLRMDLLNKTNCYLNASGGDDGGGGGSRSLTMATNLELERVRHELHLTLMQNANLRKKLENTLHDAANIEHRFNEAEQLNEELLKNILQLKEKIVNLNSTFNTETCPAEFYLHAKEIHEAKDMVLLLEDLIQKNNENIVNDSNATIGNGSIKDDENDDNDEVKCKIDAFTSKQVIYRDELNEIKQQLALKEVLHKKVFGNFSDLCSYEDKIPSKIKDYEFTIQNLEREKEELSKEMAKANQSVSAKLAEERRRKVIILEQEILETKRKVKQQAALLKQKEKDSQKITQLQGDISSMKQKKVKLIRTMKMESEEFRRWKLNREREITMLKEKNRKREHEMQRRDILFKKQSNVLKRKIEESMAVNKRLKEALDKHQVAQANRKKVVNNGRIDHISTWIDQELDIIISVIDAKLSLDQLIEDRGDLNVKFNVIKQDNSADKREIDNIQEEIDMRNAQIADLREKLDTANIETKIKTICDCIQSMPEARHALKHLFNSISDLRTEFMTTLTKYNDLKLSHHQKADQIANAENQLKQQIESLRDEKNECEKNYEDKIGTLLRELNDKGTKNDENDVIKIQKEAFDTLQQKLEVKIQEIQELKTILHKKQPKSAIAKIKKELVEEYTTDESYITEDGVSDDEDDPDWHKTPLKREVLRKKKENDLSADNTTSSFGTNNNNNNNNTNAITRKRGSNDSITCSCKGDCHTRLCGCKRNGYSCKDTCKCSESCVNASDSDATFVTSSSNRNNTNNNSDVENDQSKANTVLGDETQTPKKMKLMANQSDLSILTPSYPYEFKTKRPLLE